MSYILEAIKRSERERLSASVSRLPVLPVFGDAAKPHPLLLYGAVSAALMAAGITIGWLRPWQSGNAASAAVVAKATAASNTPMPAADAEGDRNGPAPLIATPPSGKVKVLHVMKVRPYRAPAAAQNNTPRAVHPSRARAAAAMPAVAPAASHVMASVALPHTLVATPAASPPPLATARSTVSATANMAAGNSGLSQTAREERVVALYDLPPEILRKIPQMSISGFTYSDSPEGRMVDINDHLLQEGQYVADGLKLEQITPDGLIFSYRHYRFRKNLQ